MKLKVVRNTLFRIPTARRMELLYDRGAFHNDTTSISVGRSDLVVNCLEEVYIVFALSITPAEQDDFESMMKTRYEDMSNVLNKFSKGLCHNFAWVLKNRQKHNKHKCDTHFEVNHT